MFVSVFFGCMWQRVNYQVLGIKETRISGFRRHNNKHKRVFFSYYCIAFSVFLNPNIPKLLSP